jgi:hypothetical protein
MVEAHSSRERVRLSSLSQKVVTSFQTSHTQLVPFRTRTRLSPIYDECCYFPSDVAPAIYQPHLRPKLIRQPTIAPALLVAIERETSFEALETADLLDRHHCFREGVAAGGFNVLASGMLRKEALLRSTDGKVCFQGGWDGGVTRILYG